MPVTLQIGVYGLTGMVLALLFWGCGPSGLPSRLELYRNSRYGFEFPYPADWVADSEPANRDGQAFHDPKNPDIQIRGWAGNILFNSQPDGISTDGVSTAALPLQKKNFTTQQGISGNLSVEVGSEITSVTLTLAQEQVRYNWQGQAPSQQFADRYPFFYSLAGQYRVPVAGH